MDTPSFDHIFDQHLFSLEAKPEPPTFSRDVDAAHYEGLMAMADNSSAELATKGFAEYVSSLLSR